MLLVQNISLLATSLKFYTKFIYLVSFEIPSGDNLKTLKCGRGAQNPHQHKVNFDDLIKPAEKKLLCKVKNNEYHVLRPLFPPLAQRSHSLRPRAHDFVLPRKDDKNYIPRILYRLSNSVVKS